ncbi:AMP-binding protein [Bosea sp. BIWAKO-01]|uniref:AMP-binding protein n=1 Tax=Bosea sp. BIWAKO-01 TaxID=506668 RepID=UPI00086E9A0A|nr:AMP-binding protein [Bosea sp. BIWAKO-01]GAU85550.1 long-chain-fatty-acid-CoA ligase [Bosea sp. BIWAKO-01]
MQQNDSKPKDWSELKPLVERMRANIEAAPLARNIGAFIDERALANGDKTLWTFFEESEGGVATYSEARSAIEQAAAGLYAAGVRKGSHVAVMLPNIPAFPVTWLALAKLGAVMVPVNIGYTGRELNYVLTDSQATHLVIHADCLPSYEALGAEAPLRSSAVFLIGNDRDTTDQYARIDRNPPALPADLPQPALDDLVNIQYTSGTTGFPKGCMLTHRYWLTISLVAAMRGGEAENATNILAAQPFFYMDPQWLTLMAMRVGGQVFVARRASATRFMDWVRTYKIHYCLFPEIVYQQAPKPSDADNELKRVSIFGFNKEKHADFERRYNTIARESFGMTEVGSALFLPREAYHMVGSGSCGMVAPFREAQITDPEGNVLPAGEIGELCVRGPGIMRGYYRKPEANEASFRGDWFRTGDLFWRDAEGFHYIVGRLKDMIRRSGENIAAREVEAALTEMPQVLEAAVVGVKDAARGEEVKAYIVLQPGVSEAEASPEMIFEHCKSRLAPFKTPRYVEYRDTLPKTPSEKIAKQKLIAEKSDLRVGSFDRVTNQWI